MPCTMPGRAWTGREKNRGASGKQDMPTDDYELIWTPNSLGPLYDNLQVGQDLVVYGLTNAIQLCDDSEECTGLHDREDGSYTLRKPKGGFYIPVVGGKQRTNTLNHTTKFLAKKSKFEGKCTDGCVTTLYTANLPSQCESYTNQASDSQTNDQGMNDNSNNKEKGSIAVTVIGIVAGCAILCGGVAYFVHKRRPRRQSRPLIRPMAATDSSSPQL